MSWANLSEEELGSEKETWYCKDCKAECGLYSGDVLNNHKAVQCDKCETWVHNDCSFVTDFQYETMQNSSCTWICPKCEFFNFSHSIFSEQLNLEDQNRFVPLTKDTETRTPSTGSKNNKFVMIRKRFSLRKTIIKDINFGLVRMYVTPYRFSWTIFILGLALSYTDKLLVFRWVQIVLHL